MPKPNRKPAAQPGNQNARTHGYYALKGFSRARQLRLSQARALNPTDLSDEIATLRERLDALIDAEGNNLDLIRACMATLTRLAATHYHLQGTDAERLTDAMTNVLDSIERTLKGA